MIPGHPASTTLILIQIVFAAAIAEMFATIGRSTWMTPSYALAVAIFGGFAPFIATWPVARTGSPISPACYVMAAAIVSFIVIRRVPETAHQKLG